MNSAAVIDWVNQKLAAKGWNISRLAQEAGVPHSSVSLALNGKRNSALDFWVKIARAFGPGAVGEMLTVAGVLLPEDIDAGAQELCRTIRRLPLAEQQAVERYVDFLAKRQDRGE